MITGTLYEAGKMMVMQNKWEQKKSTGNINKKEQKELTPQERELQRYREQLEETKKGNEYSALYSKIQSGQKLSPAEEDKLKAQDMKGWAYVMMLPKIPIRRIRTISYSGLQSRSLRTRH